MLWGPRSVKGSFGDNMGQEVKFNKNAINQCYIMIIISMHRPYATV